MAKSKFYRVTATDAGETISGDFEHTDTSMSFAAWCKKSLSHLENVKYEQLDRVLDNEIKKMLDKVKTTGMDPLFNAQTRERLECCRHMARIVGVPAQKSLHNVLERITDGERNYEIVGLDSAPFSFGFKVSGMYGCLFFHESSQTWTTNT